jgi:epoxyqueuosine reductase
MKKPAPYVPAPDLLAAFPPISGNTVNGLGEPNVRPPSRGFWHPAHEQPFGALQQAVGRRLRPAGFDDPSFRNPKVDRGPQPTPVAVERIERSAQEWTAELKAFALANEADLVGIAPLRPEYVYEGYAIAERWVVILGLAHDYEKMKDFPGSDANPGPYIELHAQYNRGARAAAKLGNFIRGFGYPASVHPGPMAGALLMIPPAIEAGLGELGKHGSLINRRYGSGFRLAAVTTDLPLVADARDTLNVDDFCSSCRICSDACPPDAILPTKQLVRGLEKWYVDFDKCIPYFGENKACGICIAVCPWTRPDVTPRLVAKMARRAG